MKSKFIFLLLVLNFYFPPTQAKACAFSVGQSPLISADLIFKGVVKESNNVLRSIQTTQNKPNTVSKFEIKNLYKGIAGKLVDIYYVSMQGVSETIQEPFPKNSEMTIFAYKNKTHDYYSISACSQVYSHQVAKQNLEDYKNKIAGADELIAQNPQKKIYYTQKIQLLKQYNDFESLAATYQMELTKIGDDQDIIIEYAKVLKESGHYNEALNALSKVKNTEFRNE